MATKLHDNITKSISLLDSSRAARSAGDIGSAESALDGARERMVECLDHTMSALQVPVEMLGQTMRVLLVYELVPETLRFYLLDVTRADWAWMRLTHRNYVNNVMPDKATEEACNRLTEYLKSKDKLAADLPLSTVALRIQVVIHSGFVI